MDLATALGLEDVRQDDWSEFVAPFWPAVIRSALVPRNFFRMIRTGTATVKGAIASVSGRATMCFSSFSVTDEVHVH